MIQYIIQIRNAADHGADSNEGGRMWNISDDTAQFCPMIVSSIIRDIVYYRNGNLTV